MKCWFLIKNFEFGQRCYHNFQFLQTSNIALPLLNSVTILNSSESCSDIDECQLGANECDTNAECTNNVGGYDCHCKSGFEGDGFECTSKLKIIVKLCVCKTFGGYAGKKIGFLSSK